MVLAIRGTKELADVITDALMDSSPFEGGFAHSGIVRAANTLCDTYAGTLQSFEKKGFDVVVVGHSLGAATAAAVTIKLRNSCGLRRARCVCFAPPATVDTKWAEMAAPYVMSVVHDDDFIPRSQVTSLITLYRELIEYNWLPPAKAELRSFLGCLPSWLKVAVPCDEVLAKAEATLENKMKAGSAGLSADGSSVIAGDEQPRLLHVPGFVIHLARSDSEIGYAAARVPAKRMERLELSATMLVDHLLENYIFALQALADAARQSAHAEKELVVAALTPDGVSEDAREVITSAVHNAHTMRDKLRSQAAALIQNRPDAS